MSTLNPTVIVSSLLYIASASSRSSAMRLVIVGPAKVPQSPVIAAETPVDSKDVSVAFFTPLPTLKNVPIPEKIDSFYFDWR